MLDQGTGTVAGSRVDRAETLVDGVLARPTRGTAPDITLDNEAELFSRPGKKKIIKTDGTFPSTVSKI